VTRVSISGGAGFLGLHLARRVLADGGSVRTLDVAPLEDAELERGVEEVRGDIRSE
jgi:nucleoside-diphosphate-sugar epimerase